ncbi:alpha/beta fold hydrolase [Facklamia miroungae]|uniref:AB hydrolase-1 domain-containing protein n=1 Tax=Facklamia miroungae TaxID=120956 RepID=A0A1G7P1X6_9LACT|nr:alpha/beta fold hydrolase [Facklamia miroungae]NKZ28554.1 alpha/beta fold hydrolase [Facklamia miroungae]SDF80306.1 hypothetical protein SAMN05421791_10195 [Facklamia miroungae]
MEVIVEDFFIEEGPYGSISGKVLSQRQHKDQTLPLVIFYHGWTNSSSEQVYFAMEIARQGFRVVIPDAYLHGERSPKRERQEEDFLKTLKANIEEFPILLSYFKPTLKDDFLGVAGMSMGAMTSLLLLSKEAQITAAVALMGTAHISDFIEEKVIHVINNSDDPTERMELLEQIKKDYTILFDLDLSRQPQKIANRPVFIWHGEDDPVVPFNYMQKFVNSIVNQPYSQSVHFVHEPGYHKVPFNQIIRMSTFFKMIYSSNTKDVWSYIEEKLQERPDFND